jgi:putative phage-type endonuclease
LFSLFLLPKTPFGVWNILKGGNQNEKTNPCPCPTEDNPTRCFETADFAERGTKMRQVPLANDTLLPCRRSQEPKQRSLNMAATTYSPSVFVDTKDLTEEEWLEWRRKGVGGSDAPIVLGISPFATARDLYYDKLHIVSYKDDSGNWVALQVGHLLENPVAEIFHRKTGYPVYHIKKMFYHPLYPYMLADVDYFVTLPNVKTAILEIKTTNYNAKDNWWIDGEETIPVNYEAQGRHYMAVMNLDHVFYCCLYGNSEDDVIIRHIERNAAYEEELIALEGNFWNEHVLKKVPPPYTESGDLVIQSVKSHIGPADPNAPAVELSLPLASSVIRFTELQAQKKLADAQSKKIESEMKRLQGRIVAEMGKSCTAVCTTGDTSYTVTYNPTKKPNVNKENLIRLQAQHPDIYQDYVTVSEIRRFHVKKSQEQNAV